MHSTESNCLFRLLRVLLCLFILPEPSQITILPINFSRHESPSDKRANTKKFISLRCDNLLYLSINTVRYSCAGGFFRLCSSKNHKTGISVTARACLAEFCMVPRNNEPNRVSGEEDRAAGMGCKRRSAKIMRRARLCM